MRHDRGDVTLTGSWLYNKIHTIHNSTQQDSKSFTHAMLHVHL